MFKFMSATTLLLAGVFFQASGGFDFQPRSAEADTSETGAKTTAELADAAPGAGIGATQTPGNMIAANMAKTQSATSLPGYPDAVVTLASMPVADKSAQIDPSVSALPLAKISQVASKTPSSTLPAGAERRAIAAAALQAAADVRAVAGSHVNLRQGPGTSFGVVDQLGQGETVEVIGQERSWLKLRVAETGRIGWMADFLVTAAAN
ncbi:SH3 domain-containing protein [Pseudooceanicola spongiae]|uniref:SH3 domain-containing protein n=1 Tax=Pseudooceanicola spongiae TaxID=2613965 RepID=A0A7L9WRA7_9RHOB|nr:SH3 domain-containing protein [Pseudooceanicola spongiae]QOL82819.1 SH3 domain-containing protein [Pseudooceanicola spongiae]